MLIFNGQAFIAIVAGAAGGALLWKLTNTDIVGVFGGILIAMGTDVYMRFHSEDSQYPLVDPNAGAHLWFVPIWGVGIVLMILMGLSKLGVI